jgi:hypothetical protein
MSTCQSWLASSKLLLAKLAVRKAVSMASTASPLSVANESLELVFLVARLDFISAKTRSLSWLICDSLS